jgi:hypothetical protein
MDPRTEHRFSLPMGPAIPDAAPLRRSAFASGESP